MSLDLMNRRRHADLVKAAEITVEAMNEGLHPNAALIKAAQELDLNAKEVALVSHAVNNSATVSHLANSEGKDKAGPFTLTDADEVVGQLFPQQDEEKAHNQAEPGKRPSDAEMESPNDLDPTAVAKKTAAAEGSYDDVQFYTVDPVDHAKVAAEAFALPGTQLSGRTVVTVGLDKFAAVHEFTVTANQIKVALDNSGTVDCSRLSSNPYLQLRNVKVAIEHARGEYTAARDAAFATLSKLAEAFRRTDALSFARVELLAKHAGCDADTLEVIYTMAALASIGQKRAGAMKVASHVRVPCSLREHALVQDCLRVETMWKRAADCLAAQHDAELRLQVSSAAVHAVVTKQAGEGKKDDGIVGVSGDHIKGTADALTNFSAWATGRDSADADSHSAFLGKVTGDYTEGENVEHPLDLASRQRLGNVTGAANFNTLFDDEFIAGQPIPDVVKAYNRVITAKPDIDPSTAAALVKEQLARGGGMDSDTLIRLKKDYRSKE